MNRTDDPILQGASPDDFRWAYAWDPKSRTMVKSPLRGLERVLAKRRWRELQNDALLDAERRRPRKIRLRGDPV